MDKAWIRLGNGWIWMDMDRDGWRWINLGNGYGNGYGNGDGWMGGGVIDSS